MSKSSLVEISELIGALTSSEKRSFRLFVRRAQTGGSRKYMELFDAIEHNLEINDGAILNQTSISKTQLANVKMNLKKQILKSLLLNPKHKTPVIELRDQVSYALVMYNKGLYKQSLALLEAAKKKANELDDYTTLFDIIEFEKLIETQYITRSLITRADDLAIEAKNISKRNVRLSKLSNLSLQLYSYMLKNGYVKNQRDALQIENYYKSKLPKFKLHDLGFKEKLFYYQAELWYTQIQQDFKSSYRFGAHWVDLFENDEKLIKAHPVYYLKGLNAVLDSLYYLRYLSKFQFYLNKLLALQKSNSFTKNANTATLYFVYTNYNRINENFLKASFAKGIQEIKEIEFGIKKFKKTIDQHHKMVFYYKFACLYFGEGDFKNCMRYLDMILRNKTLKIRDDLMCYSYILNIISLYEEGRDVEADQNIAKTYRFLLKMNDLHQVQREIIGFLRKLSVLFPQEIHGALGALHLKLKELENHPYEKRSFLYLDIISWLESKLENRPISEVIKEKAVGLK